MTGLTIQILAMSTACPVTIDGRRRIAVQITWLGCVVATRAVGNRPTVVPGRLGFGNAGSIAMASITYCGVRQYVTVGKVYAPIAMLSGCPARDIGMTSGAFDVDIFFKMPVVSASIGRVAVASCAGALWHKGIVSLRVAVGFVLVAQRAVGAFVMRDIGPVGGIAIMAGVGMTGGAEVVGIVAIGLVEAVVASLGSKNDDFALDHRLHCVQIAVAMGIVAGVALFDKGRLHRCAVTFVAVGADILASAIGIVVAAGAEFFRFSPQAGIII